MFRRFAAVILSAILLSPGWLGMTGMTLLIGFVPLLWVSASYDDTRRSWWGMFGWATLAFVLWNALTIWWIWYATPVGPHARFDDDEHDRLHALPHRFEKSPQSVGLRHARHGVDHDGILVHRGRLLVAVAHPGQRLLARSLGRAVVRIHGRFRRHAVGVALQHTDFRSVATHAGGRRQPAPSHCR